MDAQALAAAWIRLGKNEVVGTLVESEAGVAGSAAGMLLMEWCCVTISRVVEGASGSAEAKAVESC